MPSYRSFLLACFAQCFVVTKARPQISNTDLITSVNQTAIDLYEGPGDPADASGANLEQGYLAAIAQVEQIHFTQPDASSSGRTLSFTVQDPSFNVDFRNFTISNCQPNPKDSTRLNAVQSTLSLILRFMPIVIYEAERGVESPFGFADLFKTTDNAAFVAAIFRNMSKPLPLPVQGAIGTYFPFLTCVNDNDEDISSVFYPYCVNNGLDYPVVNKPSTSVFALCDQFFEYSNAANRHNCPQYNASTGLYYPRHDAAWLQGNKQAMLVRELTRFYLQGDVSFGFEEQFEVGGCVGLDASESARNPSSYAYFFASVITRCQSWNHQPES